MTLRVQKREDRPETSMQKDRSTRKGSPRPSRQLPFGFRWAHGVRTGGHVRTPPVIPVLTSSESFSGRS